LHGLFKHFFLKNEGLAAQFQFDYYSYDSGVLMPADPSISRDRVFRFGPFELSEREGELRRSGVRIKLQEQPFRVLVELVANAGKVVSRESLRNELWPADTFVDFDVGLNSAIRKLRQTLNDNADHPHYIETLAKRGYRFLAPVSITSTAPSTATKEQNPTLSQR
jgi:DNA-binding winged helix-turn-helix (wHTH) protein